MGTPALDFTRFQFGLERRSGRADENGGTTRRGPLQLAARPIMKPSKPDVLHHADLILVNATGTDVLTTILCVASLCDRLGVDARELRVAGADALETGLAQWASAANLVLERRHARGATIFALRAA
jgi:hypothetical protein